MSDLTQLRFGNLYSYFGSIVVLEAYSHTDEQPHTGYIRFACDHRCMQFPVPVEHLQPIEPEPRSIQ